MSDTSQVGKPALLQNKSRLVTWFQQRRRINAASRLLKENFQRPSSPIKLNLCVTYWCQYKCQTCNIWKRKPSDELSTDELLTFIAKNREIAWLDLTGGEIFLRDDLGVIFDAISRSWKNLAVLHFPTNGFLTDAIVRHTEQLRKSSSAEIIVTVSVDGNEQLNDEIRGIQGGYRRQVATFNELRRIPGVRVVFGMTLSRHNVGCVEETFEACARECPGLTRRDFHLNVAQLSEHYYGNAESSTVPASQEALEPELHRYRERLGWPTSMADWVERDYLKHLDGYLRTGRTPMRCHALRSSCFVDPWGVVFPCISYSKPVGRLRDCGMDLGAVWQSQALVATQSEIWEGNCPQCWTPCEAYQSILGNLLVPGRHGN
jgi:MoaA/NifB/PqqE/SkfB family radical SAM enzyme